MAEGDDCSKTYNWKDLLTTFRFVPTEYGGMKGRIEDIEISAIEHPLKGVSVTATQFGGRSAAQFENFMPTEVAIEEVGKLFAHIIGQIHPEKVQDLQPQTPPVPQRTRPSKVDSEAPRQPKRHRTTLVDVEPVQISKVALQQMTDTFPRPAWIYELDTYRFRFVNSAAVQSYGYSAEEFLQLSVHDIRIADDNGLPVESAGFFRAGDLFEVSWRHRQKDGREIAATMSGAVVVYLNVEAVLEWETQSDADLRAELAMLRGENERLKKALGATVSLKVSEKGAVSVYGLGRFPVTLYKEQWLELLSHRRDIEDFILSNASLLKKRK